MSHMATTSTATPRRLTWDLSDAIERMRTKAKLDQGELAEAIGASRGSISNWERGRTVPPQFKTVQRIATECGYDPEDPTLRLLWEQARYRITPEGGQQTAGFVGHPTPPDPQLELDFHEEDKAA